MRPRTYHKHKKLWQLTCLLAIDSLFFTLTNPNTVTSAVLAVGFILMVVTIYVVVRLLLVLPRFYGLDVISKAPGLAGFITVILAVVLALDSTGQLSSKDMAVIVPLTAISYVYLRSVRTRKVN